MGTNVADNWVLIFTVRAHVDIPRQIAWICANKINAFRILGLWVAEGNVPVTDDILECWRLSEITVQIKTLATYFSFVNILPDMGAADAGRVTVRFFLTRPTRRSAFFTFVAASQLDIRWRCWIIQCVYMQPYTCSRPIYNVSPSRKRLLYYSNNSRQDQADFVIYQYHREIFRKFLLSASL